ncbi:TIGR04282 family arsenosugar biosynthesis glycosyltransferase [Salinisphaera hydrothermalis]|uniref:TIGR04282 family arsenosugar biosynthesis glycosyltransferase n=1 Tax=Salinisphaera hydrothermalis TaxID=563188 RepID=UPI00333FACBE
MSGPDEDHQFGGHAALHIAVFAKPLVSGRVKTRLIPAVGADGAAAIQRILLQRTLAAACDVAGAQVSLWVAGDPGHPTLATYRQTFPITLRAQQGDDLGARMCAAMANLWGAGRRVLLIGSDCPLLGAAELRAAAQVLNAPDTDVVFTPVADGGYVLVGLGPAAARHLPSRILDALFVDIAWSTERVMAQTRARLDAAGLSWQEQPMLWDIDRPEDLIRARAQGLLDPASG